MADKEVAVLHGMGETRVITIPPMISIIRDPCFQTFGYGIALGLLLCGRFPIAFGVGLAAHLLRPDKSRIIELPAIPGVAWDPQRFTDTGDPRRNADGSMADVRTVGAGA